MYFRSVNIFLFLIFLAVISVHGGVVINEAMVNEPGSATTLEWIELYNDSENEAYLHTYKLKIGDYRITLPELNPLLQPGEYYIVCRRLYTSGSTPGFEGVWGDSSGYWGDSEYEQSLRTPFDESFSLPNTSGTIELVNFLEEVISEFTWYEEGLDGVSWERVSPDELSIGQSVDYESATPGFMNSLTPVGNDLALDQVQVVSSKGDARLIFTITNRGETATGSTEFTLYEVLSDHFEIPLDVIEIPEIESGYTVQITETYNFDGLYIYLKAVLPSDDRDRNNEFEFRATGVEYPPIVINEVMANPTLGLKTEWVEIKNIYSEPFDLNGWQIGDELSLFMISDSALIINPDEYMVLADSSTLFLDFYTMFTGLCQQPERWSTLNNNGDNVRLIDDYGITAAEFEYASAYDSNYTWSRNEEGLQSDIWGRSDTKGGSPGKKNRVLIKPDASGLTVTIAPTHISPDGDGYQDEAEIMVEAPEGNGYEMKIYDKQGRVVKTFIDGASWLQPVYYWDGRSDGGNRQPIGIYILYFEVTGVESVKKPIVIAR